MIAALGFLTVLGRGRSPSRTTTAWFPVVGALVGLAVGAAWWGAGEIWASAAVVAAVAVAVDLGLTGMLHLDGLADSADGLLPHLPRERRLAVMAEPTVGAFALGVVPVVLLLRWSALVALEPHALLLAGLWCASRTLMVAGLHVLPYARPEGGLASAFSGGGGPMVVGLGGTAAVVLVALSHAEPVGVAVGAALVAGAAVLALGRRQLGGYTGDVLGAAGIVAETVGLLVVAA